MNTQDTLKQIAELDSNLARYIDELRADGQSDELILRAIRRAIRIIEAEGV